MGIVADRERVRTFVRKADRSLIDWAKAFFPEAIKKSFSPHIHVPMARLVDARPDDSKRTIVHQKAIAAPRGCGKTTLLNQINLTRLIAMKRVKYVLIVSYRHEQAKKHLAALKEAFKSKRFIACFGDMKGDVWNEDEILCANGVRVRALGSGMAVRGDKSGWDRPDYMILDDFEDEQTIKSAVVYTNHKEWWLGALRNAADPDNCTELFLGTVLSKISLLEYQLNNPSCASVRLRLFDGPIDIRTDEPIEDAEAKVTADDTLLRLGDEDDNTPPKHPPVLDADLVARAKARSDTPASDAQKVRFVSLWPERYTNARIYAMYAEAKNHGKLNIFYQDFQNEPTASELQTFKEEMFVFWNPDVNTVVNWDPDIDNMSDKMIANTLDLIFKCVLIDPKMVEEQGDFAAVMSVGFNRFGEVFVLDYDMERVTEDNLYKLVSKQCKRWNIKHVYGETNKLGDFLTKPLLKYLRGDKIMAHVTGIHAKGKKGDRIYALYPLFSQHRVHFNIHRYKELAKQLLDWPAADYDDLMDTLAHALWVMAERNIGRAPKEIAEHIDQGDHEALSEPVM